MATKPNFALAAGATLLVADTAANLLLAANAAGIAKATTIQITGTGNSVTTTQAATLASMTGLSLAANATLAVSGSAASVSGSLGTLETLAARGALTSISLTANAPLTVTYAQTISDAAALAALPSNYTMIVSGAPASAASALEGNAHVTSFSISDTAGNLLSAANAAAIASATSISVLGIASLTTSQASQLAALPGLSVTPGTIIQITDTAPNISLNFNALQTIAAAASGKAVFSIVMSGNASLPLTYAQLTQDSAVFASLPSTYTLTVSAVPAADAGAVQGNSHVISFTVIDSAAAVAGALDALNGDSKLTAIALTDSGIPALAITGTQFLNDTKALALLGSPHTLILTSITAAGASAAQSNANVTSFSVSDTAANVAAALDALNGDSKLTAITLTDSGTPTLAITYTQLNADTLALAAVTGTYNLTISAVPAADVGTVESDGRVTAVSVVGVPVADAAAMQSDSQVTGFTVVGAAVSDLTALASDTKITGIAMADTSSNVQAALDALNANNLVTSISFTDATPTLAMTYAQLNTDTAVLGKISGSYGMALSGAPVSAAAALQANSNVVGFSITDTAANVLAALDALNADSKLGSITFTDSGTPTLAITYTQMTTDIAALTALSGSYSLTVSAVPAADVGTVESNSHVTAVSVVGVPVADAAAMQSDSQVTGFTVVGAAVSDLTALASDTKITGIAMADTSSNVQAALDALNANNLVTSISFTDATPTLAMTYAQLNTDTAVLGKISGSYGMALSGAPVSAAAALQANSNVVGFSITDTAANVLAALDALNADSKLGSITFTDSGTPTLAITYTQMTTDIAALTALSGSYSLTISGAPASAATALQANSLVGSFTLADTAANVAAALDALNSDTKLGPITLTDSSTPTLAISYSQLTSDTAAIALLATAYNLAVSGVPAADISAVEANSHVASLSVVGVAAANAAAAQNDSKITGFTVAGATVANLASLASDTKITGISVADTSANILPVFTTLSTNSLITAISFTSGGMVGLPISYAEFSSGLLTFSGSYSVAVSGAPVSAAASLQANGNVSGFSITDTAANVEASLDALNSDGKLSAITLTDPGTPVLAISFTQFADDTAAIAALTGAYTLSVSDTPTAFAGTVQADPLVSSFSVTDSAANIVTCLDLLNSDSKLSSIVLTGTPTLSLSYAQMAQDAAAIAKLVAPYNLVVSNVPAAAAVSMQINPHVTAFSVLDTSANVSAALDALNGDNKASSIVLTDGATAPLSVTYGQLIGDTAALATLSGPVSLAVSNVPVASIAAAEGTPLVNSISVTGVAVANASTVQNDGMVTGFTIAGATINDLPTIETAYSKLTGIGITDTSSAILADLDTLNSDSLINSIAFTDAGTPSLQMSFTQYNTDATALSELTGRYGLVVTDAPAAAAVALQDNPNVSSFSVSDSATNVANALDLLNGSKLSAITLTDGGTPTLAISYSQFSNDGAAIGKLVGSYNFAVNDVPAAGAGAVQSNPYVFSFTVADSTANVTAQLAALNSDSKLAGITLQTPPPPTPVTVIGTDTGDTLNFTGASFPLAIDMAGNLASVSAGLSAPSLSFIGMPDSLTLGSGAAVIAYDLVPSSGIETIANFQYGLDTLQINLEGIASNTLLASDTTVNGVHAISIYSRTDPEHGVVLLGMGSAQTAANLLENHMSFAAGIATIT